MTRKCLISRFMEDVNNGRLNFNFFLFLNLNMVLRNSAQKEFACIWRSKWVEVIAIEIKRTQIPFLRDFFVAVAVAVS